MKYLVNTCTDAHWNMAFDEFALEKLAVDEPVFYLWQNAPAVIIGRNQLAAAEVNLPYLQAHGILLARRVTGGGAVYHDLGNLNYSIVGPTEGFPDATRLIENSLRDMGVGAARSGRNDILVDGRKCSGYAKSLCKGRSLVHGTLMWDVDLVQLTQALSVPGSKVEAKGVASVRSRVANLKAYLPQFQTVGVFSDALHSVLARGDEAISLSRSDLSTIGKRADEKFRRPEWIFGKDLSSAFSVQKKFPCGTVCAHYTLRDGYLDQVQFTGDFIGQKPVGELEERLQGQHPDQLDGLDVSPYFDGLSMAEFLTLLGG